MVVKTVVNTIFNSNTYLLYKEDETDIWIIDPGSNTNELIDWIDNNEKSLEGILITHTHFDHIMGLNQLVDKFPNTKVYGSTHAIEGFESPTINCSYYHETPFIFERKDYISVKEGDVIKIWETLSLNVLETPGHDIDCISFYVKGNLFTGDALIPGLKVYTKFKKSNKADAFHSVNKLINQFDTNTMIWPGHEKNCLLKELAVL
jgi:glyoxylase-like metal-dependent hydrolase (beta-lactamase superfamily II)